MKRLIPTLSAVAALGATLTPPAVADPGTTPPPTSGTASTAGQSAAPDVMKPGSVGSGPFGRRGGAGSTTIFSTGPVGGKALDGAGSMRMSDAGDALAGKGDWSHAALSYQQSLHLWADNKQASYGLGKCAAQAGDLAGAIRYYRAAIYAPADPPALPIIRESSVTRLMEYALFLERAGQTPEALAIYRRAAGQLNFEDMAFTGKPYLESLLPDIGEGSGQVPYTSQRLQAMAHLAIGSEAPGYDLAELQQALTLAPDSSAAYFYLGKYLYGKSDPGAKAYLEKAVQLGDDHTAASAKKFLQFIR